MIDRETFAEHLTRRTFLRRSAGGLGAAALATLLNPRAAPRRRRAAGPATVPMAVPGVLGKTHFAPKAKRVIYLCQSGAPSQIELFDHKPSLDKLRGTDLPASIRMGQRLTGMTSGQANVPGRQLDVQVRAGTARTARMVQRAAPAHRRRSPTTSASSARCTPRRSTTTRR